MNSPINWKYCNWKFGETNPIIAETDRDAEIYIGNLLWLDEEGKCHEASSFPFIETLEETRSEFARCFLGVAMQRKEKGKSNQIRVATTGVFEFALADKKATPILGMFVAPAFSKGKLRTRAVVPTDEKAQAIGRVAQTVDVKEGKVYVKIESAIMGRWDLR